MLINRTMIYTENYIAKNPKGLIIITHGVALHALYYRKFAELLNDGGYSVVLYDVRGHGKSQGERGTIKSLDTFVLDLHELIAIQRKITNLPIYLLGHSMGAVITNLYAIKYSDYEGSIVLSAPTIPASYGLLNFIPIFNAKRIKTDFKDERLSNLPVNENVDPYALKYFTLKLAKLITRNAQILINENINQIKKPILVLHGSDDKLVNKNHAETFYEALNLEDKTLEIIPRGFHNLNHDIVTKETIDKVISWLDKYHK